MIIFSASLPGTGCYLTERFFAYGFIEMAVTYAIYYSGASAPAHTCETGGGLRGVVNDLL
jgi:hypothetical protein